MTSLPNQTTMGISTSLCLSLSVTVIAVTAPDSLDYPDVFLLGAAKCGTSSLDAMLRQHPDICGRGVKEKHFFDSSDCFTEKRRRAYRQSFRGCLNHELTRDSTPSYLRTLEAPQRLFQCYTKDQLASKKFIV